MRKLLLIACIICIFIAGYATAEGTAYEKKPIKFVETIYESRTYMIQKAYDEASNKIIYIGVGCSVSAVDADSIKEMYIPNINNTIELNTTNYETIKVVNT